VDTVVPKARLGAIDLFRGLAILEVVLHHVTSYAMRQLPGDSVALFLVQILNRTMHFAVPGFLLMTALVFTRSAMRGPLDLKRYYSGRTIKTLLPYLAWTFLYGIFRYTLKSLPLESLLDPEQWWLWIRTGKAYYHLYFLWVALQFYALFPFALAFFRKRWPLGRTLLVLVAAQLLIYWLNRLVLRVPSPGSFVFWYTLPIGVGMYLGANFEAFADMWRRWRLAAVALTAVGWAWYLPIALAALGGSRVDTFQYAASSWLFTTATSVALFGLCWQLDAQERRWLRPLRVLGQNSLQIYLLHPAVIAVLDRIQGFPNLEAFRGYLALYAIALLVPLAAAFLVKGSALSRLVFGR
jgi:peptidoglycan/LPS O-acetylase OafA/YrhL